MKNYVAESFHREVIVLIWKLDSPAADRAMEFKRQISFVVEVDLKQTCVVCLPPEVAMASVTVTRAPLGRADKHDNHRAFHCSHNTAQRAVSRAGPRE